MTSSIVEKIAESNDKLKKVGEALMAYKTALGSAAEAFESLAEACQEVISKPFIEVDTRDLDG